MAYCTISDVEANIGITFTATTTPSTAQVNEFIDLVYADMLRRFKARQIDTAAILDDAEAVIHVKDINQIGAAAKAVGAMFTGQTPNESTHMLRLERQYEEKMTAIEKTPGILVDDETTEEGPESYPSSTTDVTVKYHRDVEDTDYTSLEF